MNDKTAFLSINVYTFHQGENKSGDCPQGHDSPTEAHKPAILGREPPPSDSGAPDFQGRVLQN